MELHRQILAYLNECPGLTPEQLPDNDADLITRIKLRLYQIDLSITMPPPEQKEEVLPVDRYDLARHANVILRRIVLYPSEYRTLPPSLQHYYKQFNRMYHAIEPLQDEALLHRLIMNGQIQQILTGGPIPDAEYNGLPPNLKEYYNMPEHKSDYGQYNEVYVTITYAPLKLTSSQRELLASLLID